MNRINGASTVLGLAATSLLLVAAGAAIAGDPWLVLQPEERIGNGKRVVLIAADDEYRSEDLIPQLARILTVHHGFTCTVLFAINRETGEIDPRTMDNIPGLAALDTADLMVIFARFRELPDEQMKHIVNYVQSGRPIIGLRTATHAFRYAKESTSPYAKYSFRSTDYEGGFGRQVLGETWVSHYGKHKRESTRGLIAKGMEDHPIVRGCEDIWGPSDVYGLNSLQGACTPLVMGQVLVGMNPGDDAKAGTDLVPVAWIKRFTGEGGKPSRVFATTMGHGGDLKSEGFRRLLVNACYWCVGMEVKIPPRSKVDLVGEYEPNPIGVGGHKQGLTPADHAIR